MAIINVSSVLKNEAQNNTNLEDLNLNINVKIAQIFTKSYYVLISLLFALLMTASALTLLQLRELQTQVNSLMLMCQDEGNQSNHVENSNRSADHNESVSFITPSTIEHSNKIEVKDDRRADAIMLMSYNQIVSDRSSYHENNTIKINASNYSNVTRLTRSLIMSKLMKILSFDFNNKQNLRSEMKNYMTTKDEISSNHGLNRSEPHMMRLRRVRRDVEERQSGEENEEQRQNEENKKTLRQSEKENEKQRQKEENEKTLRQCKKKCERRGRQNRREHKHNNRSRPLVATFKGAIRTQDFNTTAGYIGPWVKSKDDRQYEFKKFHLVEDNMAIEVGISGLYMISVQVYYFGIPPTYSYWMYLNSEGASIPEKLITCAAVSSQHGNEVTCFTSIIRYLKKNDRLYLKQDQPKRLANMEEGHSQIQITLLDKIRST